MYKKIINKCQELVLLFICILHYILRGRADKSKFAPNKILIVQMAKLGDMICTTPMFRAVKEKYPKSKLYVLGNEINKDILRGNTDIDEYIVYKKGNFWKLVREIRQEKIDFACQATPSFIFLALLYKSGIPSISTPKIQGGFCPWETRAYKISRNFVLTCLHTMGNYAPREYLRLLEPIDIYTDETKKYLFISKSAQDYVDNFFKENKLHDEDFIVGISPAAGNRVKQWPAQRFAEVANYLHGKYKAKILIVGGKDDKKEVQDMKSALKKDVVFFDVSGILNLEELKAIIKRMKLFISVDTGPIYIAEAFSVPTIDITGPIDEKEQPPIGNIHRVVNIQNRIKPVLSVMNSKVYDTIEARRQVEEIQIEMVTKEIDSLIFFFNNQNE